MSPLHYQVMTASQPGAVAIVQWRGPLALDFLSTMVDHRSWPEGRVRLCEWDGGVDDVLVTVLAPQWGGAPVVQLMPHGSPAVIHAVIGRLREWGAAASEPISEWAYPEAGSAADARRLALMAAAESPLAITALAAQMGMPEAAPAVDPRDRLIVPARIAIVGPPNAGKSSLLNALSGSVVAIASPLAGTTRDAVGVQVTLPHPDFAGQGVSVQMLDTPGMRESTDPIEVEAQRLAAGWILQADLTVGLCAPGQAWPVTMASRIDLWVESHADATRLPSGSGQSRADPVRVDAISGAGVPALRVALLRVLGLLPLPQGRWNPPVPGPIGCGERALFGFRENGA